jgi:cellobiose phosphorylase
MFRDSTYQIDVKNPDHVCKGVRSIRVDGTAVRGNVVPIFEDGQVHRVELVLG